MCSRRGQHPSRANGNALLDPGEVLASLPLSNFDESPPVRADEPTCSLAIPVMKHTVLFGRDSWFRFNKRSYRSLPPRPSYHRIVGELELSHHAPAGAAAYAINPVVSGGGFHPRYDGAVGVTQSNEPQLLVANLVRSNGSQTLTGHYLVATLPQSDLFSGEDYLVDSGRQVIHLVGVANLDPGDFLGVPHAPLMRVLLDAMQHDSRPPSPFSGPPVVTLISAVTASSLAAAAATATPSSALLERLTPE